MSTERKGTETLVGLFLLIGFGVIAVMVVMFGRTGQGFTEYYDLTVEFPNASGLVNNSDVLLSGARIGHVAAPPRLTGSAFAVAVELKIRSDIRIPKKTSIVVGSSGLLGDRFVDVIPLPGFDPNDVAAPGSVIQGTRAGGMDELTQKGGVVMDSLVAELQKVGVMTENINNRLLNAQNLKNLEDTFANLKTTSANFSEASKKLGDVLAQAEGAVGSAKDTMKTADAAAGDLRAAIADLRKLSDSATKTISGAKSLVDSGTVLMKRATEGEGALGTLISNKQTAEDLRAFLANLRRSGPIFYKNRPVPAEETPQPPRRAR
ncbi:MAG TPA: MlaD family protein [Chthoniobacteraceae bacterium]|jgi:ABC-type transporter Mla subunit MlaD